MTSADNAISNAVSIVSVAAANATSIANAASNKASALSVVIAANSGQMTSADNAISNAVSIVSVAAANATSIANAVSNRLSTWTLDNLLNVSAPSPTSGQVIKWNSAAAQWVASADATGGGGGSVTSNELSAAVAALSADDTSIKNLLSILTSAHNALSNTVSGLGGGGASVTSAEYLSLVNRVSANSGTGGAASVTSAEVESIAANLSDMRSDHVVLSDKVSALVPWLGAQFRVLSNTKSNATSTLANISGLVLTVAADETWEIDGMMLFSTSATGTGLRLGTSVPPLSTPRGFAFMRVSGGTSAGIAGGGGQLQVSGNSANMSITGVGPAGGVFPVLVKAVFNVASAGTVRMMWAGIASTAASPVHVLPGSYFRAFRIK
jgi:hypothetical protein